MDGFEEDLKELIPLFYGDEGPQGLESEEAREKRHLMEIEGVIDRYVAYYREGFKWFTENAPCKEKLEKLQSDEGLALAMEYINGGLYCLGAPLHLNNSDYESLSQLAYNALKNEDLSLSRNLYTTLIFLNYTFPSFWIGLALTTALTGNIPETEMIYKLAIFLNPNESSTYTYYGNFLSSLNDLRADLYLKQGKELEETLTQGERV